MSTVPTENPTVSVIIPCFNAERWVEEAVESCLDQTYGQVEIIVVDDGSTDSSRDLLRKFGSRIVLECADHRGGNQARNRGLALSSGEYIQYLDADDYLLPEKIGRQVQCLEETQADEVYGDWRHQYHLPDGSVRMGDEVIAGHHEDVLEALLSDWWVSPAALLFRRSAVLNCGPWDESLQAAQDTDFVIRMAMSGARIVYQPGCYSIYRRYGSVSVGTSNPRRWLESSIVVLKKAEAALRASGTLSETYRRSLARTYFLRARGLYDIDRARYRELIQHIKELWPHFEPSENWMYQLVYRIGGFEAADGVASLKRRWRERAGESIRHRGPQL